MVILIQASQLKYEIWGSKRLSHLYPLSDGLFSLVPKIFPHSVVEKDLLLLQTLNNVRKGNFAKARHDLLIGRSLPIKVEKVGNTERWNCWGDVMEYKPFPELFQSPGKMQLIWGNCSKMGENCPLPYFFQKKSKDWRMRKLHIVTNPKVTI